jgi:SH3-like domain-containing protein
LILPSRRLRFYQAGTALQVVSRQNGWVQVTDPASGQAGWVFEQYLAPADGPTVTRTAMETTASNSAAEATRWQTLWGKHRNKAPSKWRGQGGN